MKKRKSDGLGRLLLLLTLNRDIGDSDFGHVISKDNLAVPYIREGDEETVSDDLESIHQRESVDVLENGQQVYMAFILIIRIPHFLLKIWHTKLKRLLLGVLYLLQMKTGQTFPNFPPIIIHLRNKNSSK